MGRSSMSSPEAYQGAMVIGGFGWWGQAWKCNKRFECECACVALSRGVDRQQGNTRWPHLSFTMVRLPREGEDAMCRLLCCYAYCSPLFLFVFPKRVLVIKWKATRKSKPPPQTAPEISLRTVAWHAGMARADGSLSAHIFLTDESSSLAELRSICLVLVRQD